MKFTRILDLAFDAKCTPRLCEVQSEVRNVPDYGALLLLTNMDLALQIEMALVQEARLCTLSRSLAVLLIVYRERTFGWLARELMSSVSVPNGVQWMTLMAALLLVKLWRFVLVVLVVTRIGPLVMPAMRYRPVGAPCVCTPAMVTTTLSMSTREIILVVPVGATVAASGTSLECEMPTLYSTRVSPIELTVPILMV